MILVGRGKPSTSLRSILDVARDHGLTRSGGLASGLAHTFDEVVEFLNLQQLYLNQPAVLGTVMASDGLSTLCMPALDLAGCRAVSLNVTAKPGVTMDDHY